MPGKKPGAPRRKAKTKRLVDNHLAAVETAPDPKWTISTEAQFQTAQPITAESKADWAQNKADWRDTRKQLHEKRFRQKANEMCFTEKASQVPKDPETGDAEFRDEMKQCIKVMQKPWAPAWPPAWPPMSEDDEVQPELAEAKVRAEHQDNMRWLSNTIKLMMIGQKLDWLIENMPERFRPETPPQVDSDQESVEDDDDESSVEDLLLDRLRRRASPKKSKFDFDQMKKAKSVKRTRFSDEDQQSFKYVKNA